MVKKPKKRGVKPGTKRGKYKKLNHLDLSEIDAMRANLKSLVQLKIKYLNKLLRSL